MQLCAVCTVFARQQSLQLSKQLQLANPKHCQRFSVFLGVFPSSVVLRQVAASTPRFTVNQTHAQEAEAFTDAMI